MQNGWRLSLATGLALGLGLAASGGFIGHGLVNFKQGARGVTVRGLSERIVKADLAILPISFSYAGDELTAVQAHLDVETATVRAFLKARGYGDAEVDLGKLQVTDTTAQEYNNNRGAGPRFIATQTVIVRTADVDRVAATTRGLGELVRQGVVLKDYQGPSYLFTKLNSVRPQMIAEATASARSGAEQFAHDSGAHLAGIRDANQGSFEILPRDETPGGENDASSLWKKVRVVTTVSYRLR